MTELKRYRLNTVQDVTDYMNKGGENFQIYLNAMIKFLQSLRPGQKFDILTKIPERSHEKFVKTACCYMASYQIDDSVIFSDDYRFIIKRKT